MPEPTLSVVSFSRNILTFPAALIGLAAGGIFCWLRESLLEKSIGPYPGAFESSVFILTVTLGLALLLTWPKVPNRAAFLRSALGSLILALLLGGSTAWIFHNLGSDVRAAENTAMMWAFTSLFAGYVLIAFIQCWAETGELRFPYPELARHAWSNVFFFLTGGVLAGAFWLLLLLWAQLFKLLQIEFFITLFADPVFALMVTPPVFAIGVALGREKERIISTLLGLAMMLCRFLLPLASILVIAFLITLGVRGLSLLWETGAATPLLLGMIVTMVFLSNAATQAIPDTPLLPKPLRWLVAAALLLLSVYAGLAAYATGLRIDQYGLMPDRIWAAIFVFLAALYCLGYAGVVLLSKNSWLGGMRIVNPPLALFAVALIWFCNLPILSFKQISTDTQVARLLSTKVSAENFDFTALRYKLGEPGKAALAALPDQAKAAKHPEMEKIITAATASSPSTYEEKKREREIAVEADPFSFVTLLPKDVSVDAKTMKIIRKTMLYATCDERSPCILLVAFADTLKPDRPLYFWFDSVQDGTGSVLIVENETATQVGTFSASNHRRTTPNPSPIQTMLQEGFSLAPPLYQDLKAGDSTIHVTPYNRR